MSEEVRGNLTLGLWFLSAISLIALFISAAAQGELTAGHMIITFTILTAVIIGSPLLLRWKDTETPQEKTKRRRIDKLLNEMSEEELAELKQRLSSDDDFNADAVADSLGDDGELVRRR